MQTAIVILIIVAAAIYVARVFFRGFKQRDSCACGCSGCGMADTCDDAIGKTSPDPPTDRSKF